MTATEHRDPAAKVLAVLVFMAESDQDWGVRELARELSLTPSTCLRCLTALIDSGLVEKDETTKRFDLSGSALRLAHLITNRHNIADLVRPVLAAATERSGEAAVLAVVDWRTRQSMYVAASEAEHPLRYVLPLYEWGPVSTGASGVAALAHGPADQVDEVVAAVPTRDRAEVRRGIEHVREEGFVSTHSRRIPGAVGVAAPVFGPEGVARGSITLTIPESRFDESRIRTLAEVVRDAAAAATRLTGGRAPSSS